MSKFLYKRVLLKLSGESLSSEGSSLLSKEVLANIASQLHILIQSGIQVAVVIGGGNIVRGSTLNADLGIDRPTADTMGMLATVINALALQQVVEDRGVHCRVLTGLSMESVAESFIRRRAIRHLEKGRLVIFAAGTGHPYFTTDTAAALRALEINSHALLKATNVDGIYTKDPKKHEDAEFLPTLTYGQALEKNLKVMDAAAFGLLRDHHVPLLIFSIAKPDALLQVMRGEGKFTTIQ